MLTEVMFQSRYLVDLRPVSSTVVLSPDSHRIFRHLLFNMGNKPTTTTTKQEREVILLKVAPPLDSAYVRWLKRDLEKTCRFAPKNPRAVTPPDGYVEYMRLNGLLDLNLDDPDLAHLFK